MANAQTDAEQKLSEATQCHEVAKLNGEAIRTSFLRELLLERSQNGGGVRVDNARITGLLDLAGCTGLPALILENCHFTGDICAEEAGLARLSLKGSRINGVRLRGAKLGGTLDFSAVRTAGDETDSPAWIDAHGSKIQGGVNGCGAKLKAYPGLDQPGLLPGHKPYALRLSDALIKGSVTLYDGFAAHGGVNLSSAQIAGDFWAAKSEMTAGGQDALSAQASRIGGVMVLDQMTANGCVWLMGIKIGGSLSCTGAHFTNRSDDGTDDALVANNADIGGDVLLRGGFTAEGRVSLLGAKIGGNLDCYGAHFANRHENGEADALTADSADIGGDVLLRDGFTAEGRVSLLGVKIGGALECWGARLYNHGALTAATALSAASAKIGQYADLTGLVSIGIVSFYGAEIGGFLDCSRATFLALPPRLRQSMPWENALSAANAVITGDVTLNGAKAIGHLDFEHASIGGGIGWQGLAFPEELRLVISELNDNAVTKETTRWSYRGLVGDLDDITGHAEPIPPEQPLAQLVLAHAEIGAALKAYKLRAKVKMLINLSAAKAYTLDDDESQGGTKSGAPFPDGWGTEDEPGDKPPELDLDGFTYQRIEHFPVEEAPSWIRTVLARLYDWLQRLTGRAPKTPAPTAQPQIQPPQSGKTSFAELLHGERSIAWPRQKWLNRQYSPRADDFYPQPYRHLATVLRNQGHDAAARRISKAEGDKSARGLFGGLRRYTWGLCFSYGLSTGKATTMLFITLALGWLLVWGSYRAGAMELTPERIQALGAQYGHAPASIACRQHAQKISPILYDIDMALPVVPLHQEDKCEVKQKRWKRLWAFAFFSIFGKLVTTLTLITYSGVMKPKDE